MRRVSKGTDSCKRENPVDEAVKGINTSGRIIKDTEIADEVGRDTNAADKAAETFDG